MNEISKQIRYLQEVLFRIRSNGIIRGNQCTKSRKLFSRNIKEQMKETIFCVKINMYIFRFQFIYKLKHAMHKICLLESIIECILGTTKLITTPHKKMSYKSIKHISVSSFLSFSRLFFSVSRNFHHRQISFALSLFYRPS